METKQQQAAALARETRACARWPEGWTRSAFAGYNFNLNNIIIARWVRGTLYREGMRNCYAYDVHDAAALVKFGLRKGFNL